EQGKFDPEQGGGDPGALVRAPELDVLQHQDRRRQQPGIDRTADVEVEAGQAARSRLELAAVAAPIDKKGTHQRCYQRQDEDNRETEQRRLHAVSTPNLGPRTGRLCGPRKAPEHQRMSTVFGLGPWRGTPRHPIRDLALLRAPNMGRLDGKYMSPPMA